MGSKGWIKRVLPFFATFAIGIFIAGLFGFGGPRFGRHGRWQMRAEMDRLRMENEDLKNENLRLKNNSCGDTDNAFDYELRNVPPVPPTVDFGPPPPLHIRPLEHRPPPHDR